MENMSKEELLKGIKEELEKASAMKIANVITFMDGNGMLDNVNDENTLNELRKFAAENA